MLVTYQFYKIIDTNKNPIYIGCTSQLLNRRLWQHNHDYNSQVYKAYNNKGIENFQIIPIELNKCHNEFTHSEALHYEQLLTYNYGFNYQLCNFNAGNSFYHNYNDEKLFEYTHQLLFDIMEQHIQIGYNSYSEIIYNCAKICEYDINISTVNNYVSSIDNKLELLIKELDDICCEKLCEVI